MADEGVASTEEGAAPAAPSSSPGSPGLDLVGLTKVFPGGTVAVDDVNLHVDHGEYVLLDGQSLISLAPHKRPTTTVFQHFALFPHRSVLQNVEFGLKMHKIPKVERRRHAF